MELRGCEISRSNVPNGMRAEELVQRRPEAFFSYRRVAEPLIQSQSIHRLNASSRQCREHRCQRCDHHQQQ